jgi:hypothetical protein
MQIVPRHSSVAVFLTPLGVMTHIGRREPYPLRCSPRRTRAIAQSTALLRFEANPMATQMRTRENARCDDFFISRSLNVTSHPGLPRRNPFRSAATRLEQLCTDWVDRFIIPHPS